MELLHLLIVTFLFIGPWTIYFPTDSISLRYLQILKDISFYAYVMESVLLCNPVDHNQVCVQAGKFKVWKSQYYLVIL